MKTATLIAAGTGLALALTLAGAAQAGSPAAERTASRADIEQRRAERFAKLDVNGDGKVTQDEAAAARAKAQEAMRDRAFDRLDANNDGAVSRAEFGQGGDRMREHRKGRMAARAGARGPQGGMLARLDTNGDGEVTKAEYDARFDAHFKAMDKNANGVIDPDERPARRAGRGGPR